MQVNLRAGDTATLNGMHREKRRNRLPWLILTLQSVGAV
jgi:hypothetical protein